MRDAALRIIQYYLHSRAETNERLKTNSVAAPLLKDYRITEDLSAIVKERVALGRRTYIITEIIDSYLTGAPNDALNQGVMRIVQGTATPEKTAAAVEELVRR